MKYSFVDIRLSLLAKIYITFTSRYTSNTAESLLLTISPTHSKNSILPKPKTMEKQFILISKRKPNILETKPLLLT